MRIPRKIGVGLAKLPLAVLNSSAGRSFLNTTIERSDGGEEEYRNLDTLRLVYIYGCELDFNCSSKYSRLISKSEPPFAVTDVFNLARATIFVVIMSFGSRYAMFVMIVTPLVCVFSGSTPEMYPKRRVIQSEMSR